MFPIVDYLMPAFIQFTPYRSTDLGGGSGPVIIHSTLGYPAHEGLAMGIPCGTNVLLQGPTPVVKKKV